LIEHVRSRGGSITVRELQKSNGKRYPTAEAAEWALAGLAEAGLADWQDRPATRQGGPADARPGVASDVRQNRHYPQ
jgi:hypothetical protein